MPKANRRMMKKRVEAFEGWLVSSKSLETDDDDVVEDVSWAE